MQRPVNLGERPVNLKEQRSPLISFSFQLDRTNGEPGEPFPRLIYIYRFLLIYA